MATPEGGRNHVNVESKKGMENNLLLNDNFNSILKTNEAKYLLKYVLYYNLIFKYLFCICRLSLRETLIWINVLEQGVQSFCQGGHMWWDQHLWGSPIQTKKKKKTIIVMAVIIWLIYTYYIKYNNITYCIVIISNNGRGPYSIHFMNQAADRLKFDQGPHLAYGPNFGHACSGEKSE